MDIGKLIKYFIEIISEISKKNLQKYIYEKRIWEAFEKKVWKENIIF